MFGKQKSRMSNISRIYNFENAKNGSLGPGVFIQKFMRPNNIIKNVIKENIFDLSTYFILSSGIPNDIISSIQSNTYKLNVTNYTINSTNSLNINAIKTTILNDKNKRFLILDKTTAQSFSNLGIPFFIYDSSNNLNIKNTILSLISSLLFYKIEEKIKI
jgi:lysine/ornithine N-monooxygenase